MDVFDKIYVDTDSEEVSIISTKVGNIDVMKRDPSLASNSTNGNELLLNEISYDNTGTIYVQVLCTSPFLEKETILKAIQAVRDGNFSSAFAVRREKQYLWSSRGPEYDLSKIPNSVDLEDTVVESMNLYVIRKEAALSSSARISDNFKFIDISPTEAIDLNNPEDFRLAEYVASGKRERHRKLLDNLRAGLTSALLSDIMDDLSIADGSIITNLNPNTESAKILGYAKTLRLRKKKPEESLQGIYDALKSYDSVTTGDVIVVETETPDYAYFGELNANLAIRSGASGVIVGGATRDSQSVKGYNLPVFSTHTTCVDVRGRAVLDSISMPIEISGVRVREGDLIFADSEGVVVVPSPWVECVLSRALDAIKSEKDIIHDITRGQDVASITKKYGFF
jgi:regulator of RNase E activity RraA/CMP-N-acetylneuraminic acid synthetase